jgi:hypothetical protein
VGFWAWFGIFAAIGVAGLTWYALIGLSLAKKAKNLEPAAARLQVLADKLATTQAAEVSNPELVPAIDQGATKVLTRHRAVLKANKQRKEDRQRRLIERLKNMKIDESRFR